MLPLQAADLFAYCAYNLGRRQHVSFCLGVMKALGKRVPHLGTVGTKERCCRGSLAVLSRLLL